MRRQTFERYNIEVCVSRKEEIPICFGLFMVAGAGNDGVARFFLSTLCVFMTGSLG
jgi:hypothetical protein